MRTAILAAAAGLALLAGALPAAAQISPSPTGPWKIIQGYTKDPRYVGKPGAVLDALDQGVPPEQLGAGESGKRHKLRLPRTEADARRLRENSGQSYDADAGRYVPGKRVAADPHNFETCKKNVSKADQPGGWVRDRLSWCEVGVAWAKVFPPGGGQQEVEATVYLVGYGKHGPVPGSSTDRYIEFQIRTDQFVFKGTDPPPHDWEELKDQATFEARIECQPTDDSDITSCAEGNRNGRKDTIARWLKSGWAESQKVSSAKAPIVGNDQIQRATVWGWYQFKHPFLPTEPDHSTSDSTGIRFDSAKYITRSQGDQSPNAKPQGAIFDRVDPFLAYSLKADSGYKKVADHIHKALTRPGDTYPLFTDKQIPGGKASFPIKRLVPGFSTANRTRYNANRYDKGKACDKWFPNWKDTPDDDGQPKECDEFPFASTYEGAARSRPNYDGPKYQDMFSVQPLSRAHNGLAGNILLRWYNADRILEKDAYHVKVR